MNNQEIQDNKLYLKKDLLKYLGDKGLPCSYPTLLKYEKLGVIPLPKGGIDSFRSRWRVYTGKEIKKIAILLKKKLIK